MIILAGEMLVRYWEKLLFFFTENCKDDILFFRHRGRPPDSWESRCAEGTGSGGNIPAIRSIENTIFYIIFLIAPETIHIFLTYFFLSEESKKQDCCHCVVRMGKQTVGAKQSAESLISKN